MNDREALLAKLEELRISHLEVDDCWYSCPLSTDGTCNDVVDRTVCNCVAATHNQKVDALIQELGLLA